MFLLGIILLLLCFLFLFVILFRGEIKAWTDERKARRKSMDKLFKENKDGK